MIDEIKENEFVTLKDHKHSLKEQIKQIRDDCYAIVTNNPIIRDESKVTIILDVLDKYYREKI